MEIDRRSRRHLRVQNWSFVLLFITAVGLLAWLSTRYDYQADWTASGRHTLSEASRELLTRIEGPVAVTAFARESERSPLRARIGEVVERYQRHKPDLTLEFVDPDRHPDRVRALNVRVDGELVVEYGGRHENLRTLGEQALTNALQRLARGGERPVRFLAGHGERPLGGQANFGYGQWTRQLTAKGLPVETLDLTATPAIAEDTAVLVIADPRTELLPGEVELIDAWVAGGGNLLWLQEPDSTGGLEALAETLGIRRGSGTVVDPTGQMLGIAQPAFVVVADYPEHPTTDGVSSLTLFPIAAPLEAAGDQWRYHPILRTLERSWAEAGALEGSIGYDEGEDRPGPLTIGFAATRTVAADETEPAEQRVVVVGDADFLADQYLGNGANLELGNRLVNWLSRDDSFIRVPPRTAPDTTLEMTPVLSAVIGFGFLVVIPLALLGSGALLWWRRRRR